MTPQKNVPKITAGAENESRAENWIENVNVLLIKPSNREGEEDFSDYQVCTLKVDPENYMVNGIKCRQQFPNGPLERSDFSLEWVQLFGQSEIDKFQLNLGNFQHRPPIISNNLFLKRLKMENEAKQIMETNYLDSSIALRICAARCIFQHTGHLICELKVPKRKFSLQNWQILVQQNSKNFLKLFQDNCEVIRPTFLLTDDGGALYEWWNWMTPTTVSPRYDTMFYVCIVLAPTDDADDPDYYHHSKSNQSTISWNRIDQIFECYERSVIDYDYLLSPAQVYELARLAAHHSLHELRHFVATRQRYGVERWVPVISSYKDGCIAFLPGDDYYPKTTDYGQMPKCPPRMYDQIGVEEMRSKRQTPQHLSNQIQINRIELSGYQCRIIVSSSINSDVTLNKSSETSQNSSQVCCGHLPILRTLLPVIEIHSDPSTSLTSSSSKTDQPSSRLQFNFNFFNSKL